jgi:eukaryotic-like serine/threonine-protein kinase
VNPFAKCPKCGATLAAGGRCIKCLLEIALEFDAEADAPQDEAVPAVQSSLVDGLDARVGRYKLLQKIGEGGFGVVYLAVQEEPIHRRVALKILRPGIATKEVTVRFEAERQALALMDHPNIAKFFDAGSTADGCPFFVMELVEGIKITEYCDQHEFSVRQRLNLFIQVCQAVQHAHQKGIIHRDLKPSNILVCESDGQARPKVIDFGIAKATLGHRFIVEPQITALHQLLGTPAYMSPEQAGMGSQDMDSRSDIYSLGVLLYELLTAQPAFGPAELQRLAYDEVLRVIREQEPPRPSTRLITLAPEELTRVALHRQIEPVHLPNLVKGDLDWIVMKALEKDRDRRYETAAGLVMDIQRHFDHQPVLACPPSRLYLLGKLVRRHRLACASAAAVTAALTIGLGVATWQYFQAQKARDRAVAAQARAQTEADKSVAVAQFLKEMLMGVGPAVAQGQDTKLLRGILDKTSDRIDKDLKNQPEVANDLRSTLGSVYEALGEYDKAEAALRAAIALRNGREGEDAKMAALLDNLGIVLARKDKLTEAESSHRQALLIQRRLGADSAAIAKILGNLGNSLWYQRKFTDAEPIYREALTLSKKIGGAETEQMATALGNMGVLLAKEGKPAEAEPLFREALGMQRNLLGTNHPQVARSLNNLGNSLIDQGKLADAETMFRESVDLRRRVLGNEHPDLAFSLNNLGELLMREGKFAEAETLHREALSIRKKCFGDHHADVALSLSNLAAALRAQGKLTEAEALYREALAIRRKLPGDEHRDVVQSLNALGLTLNDERKTAEAETNLREAVTMQRNLSVGANTDMALVLANLAMVLKQEGKSGEQEQIVRALLAVRKKVFGETHPAVADCLSDLASVLERQGKLAQAETACRAELALREKNFPDDWQTFDTRSQLGGILVARTNYVEAEPLLLSGYEGMKQHQAVIPVGNKFRLKGALERLVRYYEASAQPNKAAEWKKKLEAAP